MVEGLENPYRADRIADTLFVGREGLLAELMATIKSRRNAIHAVMGGRGMGKSSFAKQLKMRLDSDVLTIITSGNVKRVASTLGHELGLNLDVDDPVDALVAATKRACVAVVLDEVDLAVQRASAPGEVATQLPTAIQEAESKLHSIAFPMWWDNIRERGRDVYRRIARHPSSVPRAQWVARFGDDPRPWLEVLASTGLVALDRDGVLARGALFQSWMQQNHPAAPERSNTTPEHDGLDAWLEAVGVDAFERLVVRSLAAWSRATVEFPAAAVRAGTNKGNADLQPEAFFQIHAIVALLQHERDLTAEPEPLSMKSRGRADIKVRSRHEPTRRACVEFKIFDRNDAEVVSQVIGYAAPGDTFAAVVSVDRWTRPLRPAYEAKCFVDAPRESTHDPPPGMLQPAFYTVHTREGYAPLRVWHFLVQLRDT